MNAPKSAVTISLVPEAKGGPFIFWEDLAQGCREAHLAGFDAVEVFPPGPDGIDQNLLRQLLLQYGLKLAAVGTGAGWVKHRLHLCLPDAAARQRAKDFIKSIIDVAGAFQAPAIIGSMQGRSGDGVDHATATAWLGEALLELGEHASQYNVPLIYEPLNRYETNMCNTVAAGVKMLQSLGTKNVVLLADLFHMNIEEMNIADAIRAGGAYIGHIHFVDSNRRPAGMGHMNYAPIVQAIHDIGYNRYLSAEAFPFPDPVAAAQQTSNMFRRLFRMSK